MTVPQSLHDIQGPIQLPDTPPYLLYAGIVLALAGVLAALYWWFCRRTKSAPPPIPPGTIAKEQLLGARAMMNSSQALIYLERISEILRLYIESRFQIRSTTKTTREFLTCLHLELPTGNQLVRFEPELQQCLEQCDLAKFAHQAATSENMQAMEDAIIRFIDQTTDEIQDTTREGGR